MSLSSAILPHQTFIFSVNTFALAAIIVMFQGKMVGWWHYWMEGLKALCIASSVIVRLSNCHALALGGGAHAIATPSYLG